jgi:hypothetical protein
MPVVILSQLYSARDRGEQKPGDRAMSDYIILDALDECPVADSILSPREEVLELVEDLCWASSFQPHICVTSWPDPTFKLSSNA